MNGPGDRKSDTPLNGAALDIEARQQQLHGETARIAWRELQRFFAQGKVLQLHVDHDLVRVAAHFACDDKQHVQGLLETQQLAPVTDDQARHWYDTDTTVWSVVVAPFVLVQAEQAADEVDLHE